MSPEIEEALRTTHQIAQAQRARRDALRAALKSGDEKRVVECARSLLGMDDEEAEGDRPTPGVQRGAGRSR